MLWNGANEFRAKVKQTIIDERIETGYVDLMGYDAGARDRFREALSMLNDEEEEMYGIFLNEGQKDVFAAAKIKDYTPSMLGNALRNTAGEVQLSYKQKVTGALEPLQKYLVELMMKSDNDVANARKH